MFERFNEDARRTLFFARARAAQRDGDSITPEDLLGGVVWAAPHVVGRVVPRPTDALTSTETAEECAARLGKVGLLTPAKEIPFSDPVKLALGRGCEEADALRQIPIGAEHLLLGLLRDENSQASRTLHEAGVTLSELRRIVGEESSGD